MALNLDKMKKKLARYENSAKGKKANADYFKKLKIEDEINRGRCKKLEGYLQGKDFNKIMERLKNEHNETYQDKCYKKGCEPYPNNKYNLLMSYLQREFVSIENDKIPSDFLNSCYFFKGYYFTTYCGQGCFSRVYDFNLNEYFQI